LQYSSREDPENFIDQLGKFEVDQQDIFLAIANQDTVTTTINHPQFADNSLQTG
jgi:replication-associated recombination protein RarA